MFWDDHDAVHHRSFESFTYDPNHQEGFMMTCCNEAANQRGCLTDANVTGEAVEGRYCGLEYNPNALDDECNYHPGTLTITCIRQ